MLWYILTILFAISSVIVKSAIPNPEYAVTGALLLMAITFIFIIVSVWTTVLSIWIQENDHISLKKRKNEINAAIDVLKAKNKEVKEMTEKMLSHELEIIRSISPDKGVDPATFTDNILSKNMLAQLPDCKAISSVQTMIHEMDSKRNSVGTALGNYNELICHIKRRQGNPLVYSPFVPKFAVHFVEVENLDDPDQAKLITSET